jgi:hypothetical protein
LVIRRSQGIGDADMAPLSMAWSESGMSWPA